MRIWHENLNWRGDQTGSDAKLCLYLLATGLILVVSCSDKGDAGATQCPSANIAVQKIMSGQDIGSISTVQNMLVAAGQDDCVYIWDWHDLNEPPRTSDLPSLAWMPRDYRSNPRGLFANVTSTLLPPERVIYASHGENDTLIVVQDLAANNELRRWPVGSLWRCLQLRPTRNGKFVGVFLDADILQRREGVNRRNGGRAYRLGVISAERTDMMWLPTFFRGEHNLPLVKGTSVSEDGKNIVVVGSSDGGWISLVDSADGKVLWERYPEGPDVPYGKWTVCFNDACFSGDGNRIYVAGNTGLFCFDAADGKILKQWLIPSRAMAVALSPDERLLAGAIVGVGDVYICNAKAPGQVNEPILKLVTGQQSMYGVAFSPDSKFLATDGVNYTGVKIWKMPSPDSGLPDPNK